ncbi:MAG: alanyl-tRNA editing protein, partial [Pseudomonadota bacterium]|nr:alanyl-tRNA editing protein [Pseudomonadota bacterium]
LPEAGEKVTLCIDWERRHRLMRMHSCMHMLCAVVPAPVTGGSVRDDGTARLDFDLPEPPDKQQLEQELNRLIEEDHPMRIEWISNQELAAQPELVRTMSVQPPTDAGRVRLINFEGADLQPCGGTHVAASGEIGKVRIKKIQKKGKINRRITVEFDNAVTPI